MEKIASFCVNHLTLEPGIYLSRQDKLGTQTVSTFDLRMTAPNREPVMNTAEVHTIEHLGATFLRNHPDWGGRVLYFGPMGCRTGFYLLTEGLAYREAREAILAAVVACLGMDEVPGSHREECGNYLEHDLAGAKTELTRYLALLHGQSEDEIALEAGLAAEAGA